MYWSIFACGCVGSLAVEIANGTAYYRKWQALPSYWDLRYWSLRFLLALFGGLLALVLGAENHILAFHIGIGAPVILKAFEVNGESNIPRKGGTAKKGLKSNVQLTPIISQVPEISAAFSEPVETPPAKSAALFGDRLTKL